MVYRIASLRTYIRSFHLKKSAKTIRESTASLAGPEYRKIYTKFSTIKMVVYLHKYAWHQYESSQLVLNI